MQVMQSITLREPWLISFVTAPSKLAPITTLVEVHLGVPKFSGTLGEPGAHLSLF